MQITAKVMFAQPLTVAVFCIFMSTDGGESVCTKYKKYFYFTMCFEKFLIASYLMMRMISSEICLNSFW